MPVTGKIENWKKSHKLALRVHMMSGTFDDNGHQREFSVSCNIDNKAIFVELGDYKVTYHVVDMLDEALPMILAAEKQEKEESERKKKTGTGATKKQ